MRMSCCTASGTQRLFARSFCDCFLLDKADFTRVLRERPHFLQSVMDIATSRYNVAVPADAILEEEV